jgi:alpha-D-ribose 1-methylphosphonate 5-phosphate C-P lyase
MASKWIHRECAWCGSDTRYHGEIVAREEGDTVVVLCLDHCLDEYDAAEREAGK